MQDSLPAPRAQSLRVVSFQNLSNWVFGGLLLVVLILLFFLNQRFNSLEARKDKVQAVYKQSLSFQALLIQSAQETNLILQRELIEGKTTISPIRRQLWREEVSVLVDSIQQYRLDWFSDELKLKFASIQMNLKKLRKDQDEVEQLLNAENNLMPSTTSSSYEEIEYKSQINSNSLFVRKLIPQINSLKQQQLEFNALLLKDSAFQNSRLEDNYITFRWQLLGFCLVLLSGMVGLWYLLLLRHYRQLREIQEYIWSFSEGDIPDHINLRTDQTNGIQQGLQSLGDNLQKMKGFARAVGKGGFQQDFKIFDNRGELGRSFQEMQDGLMAVALRDKHRNWTNEGIALFGNILREYSDAQVLYDSLISNLIKYLKANQGGIFILHDGREENPFMVLKSVYAYERKRFIEKQVQPGQGLVGQAWLEKDIIYLDDTSDNYVQIVSGLGGATPRNVLIVPMINNESRVLGALEIASFQKFEDYEIDFIKRVSEMIVSAISSLKNNEKNEVLLQEAQVATERMRSKEAEVRRNLRELLSIQEEIKINEAELSGQTSAINSTMATMELDLQGKIIKANEIMLKSLKYRPEELIGQPYSSILDEQDFNSLDYQIFWNALLDGKTQQRVTRRVSKYREDVWFNATFTLVKDKNDKPYKIIKLALDITDQKELSINYQSQLEAINKSNLSIEFDPYGYILRVNQPYCDLTEYTAEDLKGKHHRILVNSQEYESLEYEEFWKKLKNGEYISGKFKTLSRTGKELWLRGSYNPVSDINGQTMRVMLLAQDITHEILVEVEANQAVANLDRKNQALNTALQKVDHLDKDVEYFRGQTEKLEKELQQLRIDSQGQDRALNYHYARAEYRMDGTLLDANQNFLKLCQYRLSEIKGLHHAVFVDHREVDSPEYEVFWKNLRSGLPQNKIHKLITKNSSEVLLNTSFTPVLDNEKNPFKIIQLALVVPDSTLERLKTQV